MANIIAKDIIDRAEIILQDITNTRWTADELLGWLNDSQREVVLHKPDANPTNESMALDAETKQTIPAGGMQLIEVVRNMGTDGNSPGRAIRLIDRKILDEQRPDWHSETAASEIKHYCFDERDPRNFYVYPPADGTTEVELVYSSAPDNIADDFDSLGDADTITLDNIYANALLDYIIYRAYLKDAEYAANDAKAQNAYRTFLQSVGKLDTRETLDNPYLRDKLGAGVAAKG